MKRHFVKLAVLMAGIVLLATSISEAQRRQPGGQRGQRGGFGRGSSTFGLLPTNTYLQKEIKLTSSQIKRIKEINLQMQGGRALTSEVVAKELGLSDGQKEKISAARRKAYEGLFGGRRPRGGNDGGERKRPNFEDIRKRFTEAGEKANKAAMAVLTSSQKSKWKKMLGSPVDMEKARQRPDRGRRGGGRPRPDV